MTEPEPSGIHRGSCAVWVSAEPAAECDCGAGQWPYVYPEPGSTAEALDRINPEQAS